MIGRAYFALMVVMLAATIMGDLLQVYRKPKALWIVCYSIAVAALVAFLTLAVIYGPV